MEQIDIIQILRQFKSENHKKYSILSIGIFGSVARDSFKDQSDIDVVVELGNPDLFNLIGIKQELEERFHCPVDVVRYRDKMNGFLKHRIDQEAVYAWQGIDPGDSETDFWFIPSPLFQSDLESVG